MKNIRILTSTSLFDGHDASINIMRRVLQEKGVEIIHLGHNRSALEIVTAAIEEDVHGIAITSYQGGHMEFFSYLRTLLNENGYQHIKIVGGGGGTILPKEVLVNFYFDTFLSGSYPVSPVGTQYATSFTVHT